MAEGEGGGGQIPQPLIVTGSTAMYPSVDALIIDLAMKLFVNTNFDDKSYGRPPQQAAMDCIVRAEEFVNVAGDRINSVVFESEE